MVPPGATYLRHSLFSVTRVLAILDDAVNSAEPLVLEAAKL